MEEVEMMMAFFLNAYQGYFKINSRKTYLKCASKEGTLKAFIEDVSIATM